MSENERETITKALETLAFWACCFDYKRFTASASDDVAEAEQVLTEFIDLLPNSFFN